MVDKKDLVNLDALIPRADLFEMAETAKADAPSIKITDLKPGLIYSLLRKPDFQRETANWTPKQVASLIRTFATSDIIPAIILWQHGQHVFVVDGAHRLSALVAWVHNDYGAGEKSLTFFKGIIPEQQRTMHEETMALVEELVGPWEQYERERSMLGMKAIQIQWITSQNAKQAADAFIRINQGGTIIDSLETRILRAKRSALAVATRVITRGGTGHQYWRHFSNESTIKSVPKLGSQIYSLLFSPVLSAPIKTLDLPLAGFGYGAQVIHLAFDLVSVSNRLSNADSTRKKSSDDENEADDETGVETQKYLKNTKRMLQLVLSNDPKSLGLHPALYFYTSGGNFQAASLLNILAWIVELDMSKRIPQFLKARRVFEELLLKHPVIVKPATHKLGSGARTRTRALSLFNKLLEMISRNGSSETAWRKITKDSEFSYLLLEEEQQRERSTKGRSGNAFSRAAKSNAFLTMSLPSIPACQICGGLLHRNGMVTDHKEEKSKGGSSSALNARWIHPVCNSNRSVKSLV